MVRALGVDVPRLEGGAPVHSATHLYVSGVLSNCEGAVAF
jgi:hypothetical protein